MTTRQERLAGFTSGELSPELRDRTDLPAFAHGLALARNYLIAPNGSADNRPGFQLVRQTKYADKRAVCKTFIFGGGQNYLLEFGHLYLRFHQAGATVMDGGVPYEITTPYEEDDLPYLKLTQSGDVVVITLGLTHRKELKRIGHANWTLTDFSTTPTLSAPSNLHMVSIQDADAAHPGKVWDVYVTAYKEGDTPEESLPSALLNITIDKALYPDRPAVYAWNSVNGATHYNLFRGQGGKAGYIGGTIGATSFRDDGQIPVYSDPPPTGRDPFAGSTTYEPQCSAFHALRLWFANSYVAPSTLWATQHANFHNFDAARPPRDQDAITATLATTKFDEIRAMLSLAPGMYLFGSTAEWIVLGYQGAAPTPNTIDPQPLSYWGSSWVDPIIAGDMPLYVTDSESHVRELLPVGEARDLSALASHLFLEHEILSMAYSRSPYRTVYCVRDDGVMLALSYVRQQQQVAWSWLDTDGEFESVATLPEGLEDAVYVEVKRTVEGSTVRYIERMATRQLISARWGVFLDGSVFFDGENGNPALVMTLLGTTLTCSEAIFTADDVGDEVVFLPAQEGGDVRLEITAFGSGTSVTVQVIGVLPAEMTGPDVPPSGYATADWGWGRSQFADLGQLEGENVLVLADGEAVGPYAVEGGTITLEVPAVHVAIGRSYYADFGLLDDAYARLKQKNVVRLGLEVVRTSPLGLLIGQDLDHLLPYVAPPELMPGVDGVVDGMLEASIAGGFTQRGTAFVRQSLPLPISIVAAVREIFDGDR